MAVSMLDVRRKKFEAIDGTAQGGFREAVLKGLSLPQKEIPSRFFYDERGSLLFEEITRLDVYYPTRCELEIYTRYGTDIAAHVADTEALIEFGSGSNRKIRALLSALPQLKVYTPIDISQSMLEAEARDLAADFPALEVVPVHADFMGEISLPAKVANSRRLAFFPGSTIGNLVPREAMRLLERMRRAVGEAGKLLIGVDLKKDVATLLRAYDDPQGVTAAFNLNLLARVNRELGGDFDLGSFAHEIRYDANHGRIEMHLRSLKAQTVTIGTCAFRFAKGETIHTENSYKFTADEFHLLARAAGFEPLSTWTDAAGLFSVHLLQGQG